MNLHARNQIAMSLPPALLAMLITSGMPLSRISTQPEPRRWQLREQGGLPPHTHAKEIAKRQGQRERREAKRTKWN